MRMQRTKLGQGGFTLIEIMVVVAIVAVLSTIAYGSYRDSVVKSKRKAAAACSIELAQFMERYYTTNMTYVGAALPNAGCRAELALDYAFGVAGLTATGYTISATPVGAQLSSDTLCGTLGVNERGQKSKSGSGSLTDCW